MKKYPFKYLHYIILLLKFVYEIKIVKKRTKQNPRGAGRHEKYGEPTKPVTKRVPISKVEKYNEVTDKLLKKWEKKGK